MSRIKTSPTSTPNPYASPSRPSILVTFQFIFPNHKIKKIKKGSHFMHLHVYFGVSNNKEFSGILKRITCNLSYKLLSSNSY
jgi:hypothetical protein